MSHFFTSDPDSTLKLQTAGDAFAVIAFSFGWVHHVWNIMMTTWPNHHVPGTPGKLFYRGIDNAARVPRHTTERVSRRDESKSSVSAQVLRF